MGFESDRDLVRGSWNDASSEVAGPPTSRAAGHPKGTVSQPPHWLNVTPQRCPPSARALAGGPRRAHRKGGDAGACSSVLEHRPIVHLQERRAARNKTSASLGEQARRGQASATAHRRPASIGRSHPPAPPAPSPLTITHHPSPLPTPPPTPHPINPTSQHHFPTPHPNTPAQPTHTSPTLHLPGEAPHQPRPPPPYPATHPASPPPTQNTPQPSPPPHSLPASPPPPRPPVRAPWSCVRDRHVRVPVARLRLGRRQPQTSRAHQRPAQGLGYQDLVRRGVRAGQRQQDDGEGRGGHDPHGAQVRAPARSCAHAALRALALAFRRAAAAAVRRDPL